MQNRWDAQSRFLKECDIDGYTGSLMQKDYKRQIVRLASLYEKQEAANKNNAPRNSIPRIVHQIWIGKKTIPSRYQEFMKGWKQQYPNWEHRLWTDNDIKNLNMKTADVIANSNCIGQKTDLIRVEILNQFGGLYVDCDYESIKPIDEIHANYDFYGTLRALPLLYLGSPYTFPGPLLVCNSLIGARAGHPILGAYLERVQELNAQPELFKLGWYQRYSLARFRFSLDQVKRIKETTLKTYIPFHETITDLIHHGDDRNIIFPPNFFNPIDFWYPYRFVIWRWWTSRVLYSLKEKTLDAHSFQKTLPDTFAIHHSQANWLQA